MSDPRRRLPRQWPEGGRLASTFTPSPHLHRDPRVQALAPDTLACYLLTGHWSAGRGYHGFVPQSDTCLQCDDGGGRHSTELVDAGLWLARWEEDPGYRYTVSFGGDSPVRFVRSGSRVPLDPNVREYVFWRDDHRCRLCRSRDRLVIDHIWPWALGGSDRTWNLRLLCRACNTDKGVSLPEPGAEDCVGVFG